LDQSKAIVGNDTVPLTAASMDNPNVINKFCNHPFLIRSKVDLTTFPSFLTGGGVRMFVDRSTTPIPATNQPDGYFVKDSMKGRFE
jgi:hypothetical protein